MLDVVAQTFQMAVGFCFAFAVIAKLTAFRRFEEAVSSFEIVDRPFSRLVSIVVIALEGTVAFAFTTGVALRLGILVAVVLWTTFLAAIVSVGRRGVAAKCMCYGYGEDLNVPKALVRLALIGVGVGVVYFDTRYSAVSPSMPWWTIVVATICTLVACVSLAELPATMGVASGRSAQVPLSDGGIEEDG